MTVANPYFIHIQLYWPNGTRPNQNEIARVNAFDVAGTSVVWQGQSGYNPSNGGWQDIILQNTGSFSSSRPLANLRFEVINTAEQNVHTTQVFNGIPSGSTVKIVIGQSDELLGGWLVSGTVSEQGGGAISVGSVRVEDFTSNSTALLGTSALTPEGVYSVSFNSTAFNTNGEPHAAPNVLVKYLDEDGVLAAESVLHSAISSPAVIDLVVAASGQTGDRRVFGDVRNTLGLPVSGLVVRAHHLAWTSTGIQEIPLGKIESDGNGSYEIHYALPLVEGADGPCAVASGQGEVNLVVTVDDGTLSDPGEELARTATYNNAPVELLVNVEVDAVAASTGSEYSRIHEKIAPCLGGDPASEKAALESLDERDDYLVFVASSIGVTKERLKAYVRARLIAIEINDAIDWPALNSTYTDFDPEIIYALIRDGRGDALEQFLAVEPSEFYGDMVEAIDRLVIRASFEAELPSGVDNSLQDKWAEVLAHYLSKDGSVWQNKLLSLVINAEAYTQPGTTPEEAELIAQGKIAEVSRRYYDFQGSLEDFFASLVPTVIDPGQETELFFIFECHEALDQYFPMVKTLHSHREVQGWETIADLAKVRLDGSGNTWLYYASIHVSNNAGKFPGDISGRNHQEKTRAYAERLYAQFGASEPEVRFVDEAQTVAADTGDAELAAAATFITEHEDFHLTTTVIDPYIAALDEPPPPDNVIARLKQLQRVNRLTPKFEVATALVDAGYDSAVAIAQVEEDDFVVLMEPAIGLTDGRAVHRKAKHYSSEVFSALLRAHQKVQENEGAAAVTAAARNANITENVLSSSTKFPNWLTLFGALNNCGTKHCQTVLSPGAYLTDLLQFISSSSKNLLLDRRPDLIDIEITCANTDQVLPYIDLVIEALEAQIAPHRVPITGAGPFTQATLMGAVDVTDPADPNRTAVMNAFLAAGYLLSDRAVVRLSVLDEPTGVRQWAVEDESWRFHLVKEGSNDASIVARGAPQTSENAADLDVFPEHSNPGAAVELARAVFPFQLPLAMGREEIDLVLKQRSTSRAEVLDVLQLGRPANVTPATDTDIFSTAEQARSYLHLTFDEENAIVLAPGNSTANYWGFSGVGEETIPRPETPTTTITGPWIDLMGQMSVFMNRTQLKYAEVQELLDTVYVHGDDVPRISIFAEEEYLLNCNYYRFELLNLSLSAAPEERLRKINFFLRLRRTLGWNTLETDRYLNALMPDALPTSLVEISQFVRVLDVWKLSVSEGLVLLADLGTRRSERQPRSQFDDFFKKGSPSTPEYKSLEELALGASAVPTDPPVTDPNIPVATTDGFKNGLRVALRLTQEDIDELWVVVPAAELTVPILSSMARVALFCRVHKLSVQEFWKLFDRGAAPGLLGLDLFPGSNAGPATLENLNLAHEAVARVRMTTLSPSQLDYLLRHRDQAGRSLSPSESQNAEVLADLSSAGRGLSERYPVVEAVTAEQLTAQLSEFMPETRIARMIDALRRPAGEDASAEVPYFTRYLEPVLGTGPEAVDLIARLTGVADIDEAVRFLELYTALRPPLLNQARKTVAIGVATEITGVKEERIRRLLSSSLTSITGSGQPALEDWLAGLSGWDSGDAAIDRFEVSGATTWTTRWAVPADGKYRPIVRVDELGAAAPDGVSLSVSGAIVAHEATEELDGSTLLIFQEISDELVGDILEIALTYSGDFAVSMMVRKDAGDPRLLAAGEVSPFDPQALLKLHKALLLTETSRLTADELLFLSDRYTILDTLPLVVDGPGAPSWADLFSFVQVLALSRSVKLDETSLMQQWRAELSSPNFEGWSDERVAQLSGWRLGDVMHLREHLFAQVPEIPSYSHAETWRIIAQAMDLLRKLGLSASQALSLLVEGAPSPQNASILRASLRSLYSDDGWRSTFKSMRNELRQKNRDAVVGYLTSRDIEVPTGTRQFVDENDLFAYFLIDVEMEPDVQLSRIKLALNVVQLFVQRALMGLEGDGALYDIESKKTQWVWMKNYRVWEANRKVFLFPENWIEPELRDDKTQLFAELEDAMLQDELSAERAHELLAGYVEGLDELSKLQVVGVCAEGVYSGGRTGVLHIVARTRAVPYTYYHRTFDGRQFFDGLFTPWKKIPLEIDAQSVAPVVVGGALLIAWTMLVEKGKVSEDKSEEGVEPLVEIRFLWSKLIPETGKWSKPKAAKQKIIDYDPKNLFHRDSDADGPISDFYHFRTAAGGDGSAVIELIKTNDPTPIFPQFPGVSWPKFLRDSWLYFVLESHLKAVEALAKVAFDEGVRTRNENNAFLMPQRLGTFTITPEGGEKVELFKVSLSLSGNLPRATTILHNAAVKTWYEVDGEMPRSQYAFRGKAPLLRRLEPSHRTISTNLGFLGQTENKPFFLETNDMHLFGVHQGEHRVPGLNEVVEQGVQFSTFNHPVMSTIKEIYRASGAEAIMQRLVQALPASQGRYYYNYSSNYLSSSSGSYKSGYTNKYNYGGGLYLGYRIAGDLEARWVAQTDFEGTYQPGGGVQQWYPWPTVDFQFGTSFGIYNWELFFHVPMLIAERLSQEMRFEEAMKWYHFVFDPRQDLNTYEKTKKWARKLPPGARYWNFLPFFANDEVDETLLDVFGVTKGLKPEEKVELTKLISEWRAKPFNPHLIARQRPSAYQKSVVMKYLDNLIAWADQLFRRDTFESINEATQLYIIASEILGDRSEIIEPVTSEARYTYRELEAQKLSEFSNVMVEVESLLVGNSEDVSGTEVDKASVELEPIQAMSVQSLYFSIPRNTKLDGYWDTVQDRLFKIRNSMNIDGVKRTLALFAPPIDPALLVKAAAAGLDLGAVLSQLNRPMPHYRFRVWAQKATELAGEVKSFGAALLSALEKKDGEELALLRQGHEIRVLKLSLKVREDQVNEAEASITALQGSRALAVNRFEIYSGREYKNSKEDSAIKLASQAKNLQIASGSMNTIAGALGAIPQVAAGAFSATVEFGGQHLNSIFQAIGSALGTAGGAVQADSIQASTLGGYDRRQEDWDMQIAQAALEIEQIDQQIVGAEIRLAIAEKELSNQEVQIEQSEEVQIFLQDKFSNQELYKWMAKELTRTYRQAFTLAYDVAKTAERTYRFELGIKDSDFIQFGYMDGPRGLLAGEKLGHDIKRMDVAYLEQDKREMEITKPISLLSIDPSQLQALRETGACEINLPEVLFDLDFPGQYFRRIRAVRVSIPCVTGPYTSVSAKLSLLSSAIRVESTSDDTAEGYPYQGYEDPRFAHSLGGAQSIATSTAQDDAGVFELNFKDERYLPFEGGGAVSRWRLELPAAARQFDYHTISDVILNMSYTAREAGGSLKVGAEAAIDVALNGIRALVVDASNETGLVRVFSMKREFPDALHQLLSAPANTPVSLSVRQEHFPYLLKQRDYELQPFQPEIRARVIVSSPPTSPELGFQLGSEAATGLVGLVEQNGLSNVLGADLVRSPANTPIVEGGLPEVWTLTASGLSTTNVEDVLFELRYRVN